MLNQLMSFILIHWVNPITLQEFVKNLSASCRVVVNGIAINGERCLSEHAEISRQSMFNCGF
jgi:hypothetical protein